MRHLIDITDLSVEELDAVMDRADDIIAHPEQYAHACDGKKIAALFFEPSTRTRLSFEAAMSELGGKVLSVTGASSSSQAKGESVSDTIIMASCYVDIIAMRHPKEGAAFVAAGKAGVPFINAGDGGHLHPTQTLADLLTIRRECGRLTGLTVGMCGDLKYGRTVHSLTHAMQRYPGTRFVFISPEELKIPAYVTEELEEKGIPYEVTTSLSDALPSLDILYMTRVQRERFDDPEVYERLKDSYILNAAMLENAKDSLRILHPLPRVNEISTDVDGDIRACYFKEALYGKYMRMALILFLLEQAGENGDHLKRLERIRTESVKPEGIRGEACENPRCSSGTEQELPPLYRPTGKTDAEGRTICRCIYCETEKAIRLNV